MLQTQVEPEICLLITPKTSNAAPGASRALRWIYQSALRAMPLQHRCDRAHSLLVVMAPLLTGSLTFIATIPLFEKSLHLYTRTKINDIVKHIPWKLFSAAAIARRSLSYVSERPSFLTPSSYSSNVLFYLFLSFFRFLFVVALHRNPNVHKKVQWILLLFFFLLCIQFFNNFFFSIYY